MFVRARSRSLVAIAGLLLTSGVVAATPSVTQASIFGPYCGKTVVKASGGTWKCTFADEFNGRALDSNKWSPLLTANTKFRTPDCRVASNETLKVGGGYVRMSTVKKAPFTCTSPNGNYTSNYQSGGITSHDNFSQTFGRYEFRAAFPGSKDAGMHSALWMWPKDMVYGSRSGEIDVAEYFTGAPGRAVPTVHYDDYGTDPNTTNWHCYVSNPAAFHTYAVEWTTTTMTFLYDGKVCLVDNWKSSAGLTKPAPFDEPYFLVLNQSIGGGMNAPTAATDYPGTMYVDYVHAWS
jgi:beta-glucanase (GH16 family)